MVHGFTAELRTDTRHHRGEKANFEVSVESVCGRIFIALEEGVVLGETCFQLQEEEYLMLVVFFHLP